MKTNKKKNSFGFGFGARLWSFDRWEAWLAWLRQRIPNSYIRRTKYIMYEEET